MVFISVSKNWIKNNVQIIIQAVAENSLDIKNGVCKQIGKGIRKYQGLVEKMIEIGKY